MEKKLALVLDSYSGITKKAADMLSGSIAQYLGYEVLPTVTYDKMPEKMKKERTIIALGRVSRHPILKKGAELGLISVPDDDEGYSVYVGKSFLSDEGDIVLIGANDERGVLYGCADFCNEYLSLLGGNGYIFEGGHFDNIFARELVPYSKSSSPAIKTRAIWTWGHMIYDYRSFFENMARIRLNTAVIWNDACPINAGEVVDYAHSLGIKVIWGFSWGWDTGSHLEGIISESGDEFTKRIKEKVLYTFENDYKGCGDGIYFQSFTEVVKEDVGGKSVADEVTKLVNNVAGELFERYPELHIEFGLHATSVKTKTDIIAGVDKRIHIVWEDCGAFPYAYSSSVTEGFDETLEFTKKLLTLRGADERFGAVLKGLVCLDWFHFVHFKDSYILGEHPKEYVQKRAKEKEKLWQNVTAGWIRNAELARQTVELIAKGASSPIVEMLVEDGCFEAKIPMPTALLAEMLWSPEEPSCVLLERVSKYPFISL